MSGWLPVVVVGVVVWLTAPSSARADVIAPDPPRDACAGKAAGDACELGDQNGACTPSKCQRNIGGVLNPSVIEEDCLLCDPKATPKSVEPPTPTPTPAKTEPAKTEPAKTEPAKSEPTKTEPAKSAADDGAKSSVCSVTTERTPFASVALGIVLLALACGSRR